MSTPVPLPALGESVTEGTVSRWLKQVGDTVEELSRQAGDAAGSADVGRDTLERHHRACARVLRDLRLLGGGDVHDHATLEHLRQILVQFVPVVGHRQPFVESYSTLLQSGYLLTQILTIFRYKIM